MTVEPNYYELLGVKNDASADDIKTAFRQQALRNHPDQGGNPALFRILEEAYATLSNAIKRAEYDAMLASAKPSDDEQNSGDAPTGSYAAYAEAAHFTNRDPDAEPQWGSPRYRPEPVEMKPSYYRPEAKSRNSWRRFFWVAFWVFIAFTVVTGVSFLPGIGAVAIVGTLVTLALAWLAGSLVLRLAGWFLILTAVYAAHFNDASAASTVIQVLTGFGVWLCGQWFYTFRTGTWHSVVAFGILGKLPAHLQPDRRFKNAAANIGHTHA